MQNRYNYLFPFEKVPKESRIIIYGAGNLGREYLKQIIMTKYCHAVAFIDKNASDYPSMIVPVCSPDDIGKFDFDYAVIAIRGQSGYREAERLLIAHGVKREQIINIGERINELKNEELLVNKVAIEKDKAFSSEGQSLAVYLAGGLGDFLTQKRLLVEIFKLVPQIKTDLYVIAPMDFIKLIYSDCSNINGFFMNTDKTYEQLKERYNIAMLVSNDGFVKVEFFDEVAFKENANFTERIKLLKSITEKELTGFTYPLGLMIWQRIYKGQDCYTGFSYDGIFDIKDKQINIPDDIEAVQKFNNLHLGKYITMNVGNGSGDNSLAAKTWPRERFEETAKTLKKIYPSLQITQIGDKKAEKIDGADFYFLGEKFGLVAQILKHALIHIDIEGGMTHFASQLGTKCVVLFGPTPQEYLTYEGNIHIQAGKCHNCYGLYLDANKCARNLKEPECMYSITPEMVVDVAKSELAKYF